MTDEYTGQVKDGPETGNLISASVSRWRYEMNVKMYVDGETGIPSDQVIRGWYVWDKSNGAWVFDSDGRFGNDVEAIGRIMNFDPDWPGCAPEMCGGSRLDPCEAFGVTHGRVHDHEIADDMRRHGLDPSDRDLFLAVLDAGGPANYLMSIGVDARADHLVEGDLIFSDATGQWHRVVEVGTHNGSATITIDRNDERTFRFKVMPDTTFRTRFGEAHVTAVLFGADRTIYSKGD